MTKKVGIFGKVAPEKDATSSGQGASMPLLKDSCGQDCFPAVDMLASVDTETFQQLSCDGAMLISAHGLSTSKAICLFVALSFHSMMEGIGLGTQKHTSMLPSPSELRFVKAICRPSKLASWLGCSHVAHLLASPLAHLWPSTSRVLPCPYARLS